MEATFFFHSCQKNISIQSKRLWSKLYILFLGNISKGFTANNMKKKKKKNRIKNGYANNFSVIYNIIGTSNVINIHKHLMKNHDIK